jgi:hypothetical protein
MPTTPPGVPEILSVTPTAPGQLSVTWRDNSANESGFELQRFGGMSSGWMSLANRPVANATTYTDTGLVPDKLYGYRIRAVNEAGIGAWSNVLSATPAEAFALPAPSGLTATAVSMTQINLAWRDNSAGEEGFQIGVEPAGGWTIAGNVGRGVTSYRHTGLAPGTSYRYRVRAYLGEQFSPYSNIASATTPGGGTLPPIPASNARYVAPGGSTSGDGSLTHPWDIVTGLTKTPAGTTLYLRGGTYKLHVPGNNGWGYFVRCPGRADAPVHIRPYPNERVTIDSGFMVDEWVTDVWIWDLDIRITAPRGGPVSGDPTRPLGGWHCFGPRCKLLNCTLTDCTRAVGMDVAAVGAEVYGCIIRGTGYFDTSGASVGHAAYCQNAQPTMTVAENIILDRYGNGYSIHAFGHEAHVDHLLVEGNIAWGGGPFLIGGGVRSRGIWAKDNIVVGHNMDLGYAGTIDTSFDLHAYDNTVVDGRFVVNKWETKDLMGNREFPMGAPRPGGVEVFVRPNKYDRARAHVAIMNFARAASVTVDASALLQPGDRFRLLNPRDFWGAPVAQGEYRGPFGVATGGAEFACFVLKKEE